jgi:glucosamine--fructose-6-phosphate aminotransferase (isomerizing)
MGGVIGILSAGPAAGRLTRALALLDNGGTAAGGLALLEEHAIERRSIEQAGELENCRGRAGIAFAYGGTEPRDAMRPSGGSVAAAISGVLKNARALKRRLIAAGRPIASGADIIEELITIYLERGHAPESAMTSALPHLQGEFSLVCMFAGEQNVLIGAARGAPLAAGFAAQDVCLSSSSAALAGLACQIHSLERGDLAILSRDRLAIVDSDGMRMERSVPRLVWSGAPARASAPTDIAPSAALDVSNA